MRAVPCKAGKLNICIKIAELLLVVYLTVFVSQVHNILVFMTNCLRTQFYTSAWFLSTFHSFRDRIYKIIRIYVITLSFNDIKWKTHPTTSPPRVWTRVMSSTAGTYHSGSALMEMKLFSILFQTTQPFLMCLGYICHALV